MQQKQKSNAVNKKIHTLPSNSLLITIVISLIIGIICSLLLLLEYNNFQIRSNVNIENKLERNLQSAINLAIADTSITTNEQNTIVDLFNTGNDTALITKGNWGLYSFASLKVSANGKNNAKRFFFGQEMKDNYTDECLYLAEHKEYLSLVGNTILEGNAYLPTAGLRPSIINQRGYSFAQLIKGNIKISADSLPPINPQLIQHLSTLSKQLEATERTLSVIPDSLQQSFSDSTIRIYQSGPIILSSCNLKGHILIVSDSSIEIGSNAFLNNVLLSAPIIKFDDAFSGTVQAVATDSIVVKDNCHFFYPSSLTILKIPSLIQPSINIGENCMFEGTLLTYCTNNDISKTLIKIGKNTIIKGIVYSSGYLNLSGIIYGTVLTNYFIYNSTSSVYTNYLVDAEISRDSLSKYFIMPHIFNISAPNKIAQWVQ
ncbi:MAG TPA: hypothetical protein VK705_07165 [Ferruginibacter sp.]|nr:hypothetical protein [Ferruginibacter sp.]